MSAAETSAPRYVRCPHCGGKSLFDRSNAFRPFCSERCRLADLGQWASEGFRVPIAPGAEGDDGDHPQPARLRDDRVN